MGDLTTWSDGWWSGAIPAPAHPGRLGGAIVPHTVVVHTTDEFRAFRSQLDQWCQQVGNGTCAHFYIGRTASDGVIQLAPINRNANHAGGPVHGWWVDGHGNHIHPNLWAVGVELDCGGELIHSQGVGYFHPDTKERVPDDEVFDDGAHGWHAVTEYQLEQLGLLLDALAPRLAPLPDGTKVEADGDHAANGVPWAASIGPVVVQHATLDPKRKTDSGPQAAAWLLSRQK